MRKAFDGKVNSSNYDITAGNVMRYYNFQDKDGSLRPDFNSETLSRGNEAIKIE